MTDQVVECEHGARCGGCALLRVPVGVQLTRKRELVRGAFGPYLALSEVEVGEVAGAVPVTGYRTRAKLVVSPGGAIGLYARGTHDVVDIPGCRVLSPLLSGVIAALRQKVQSVRLPLRGLDVREVRAGQAAGVLLTVIGLERDREQLVELARDCLQIEGVIGTAWSAQPDAAAQLLGEAPRHVAGVEAATDVLTKGGPHHYVTAGSFVQAHRGQAQAVALRVLAQLRGVLGSLQRVRVLELYAGSGALGLLLRKEGAAPVLVERYEPALGLLSRAAAEQDLEGIAVRAGDAETVLGDLVRAAEHFDAVIVNPPRRGLSPLVRAQLVQLGARAVVYVSCDPQTLARDLSDLALRGLRAAAVAPFDMMPLCEDVESVVLLTAAAPSPLQILHQDEQLVVVDKPPHLPTIPQSEHERCVLELLRAQLGVPNLFAVHRLDIGTSGVCLFVKHSEQVAPVAAALAAGHKRYLALLRGIVHAKGTIRTPLRDGGVSREATTRYTRQALVAGHSLVRVRPEQGRTHQVRKHLASIGHPVLGDARFGDPASNRHFEHKHGLDRTFLHLAHVELAGLGAAPPLVLTAPLAPDLAVVLARLRATSAPT